MGNGNPDEVYSYGYQVGWHGVGVSGHLALNLHWSSEPGEHLLLGLLATISDADLSLNWTCHVP